MKKYSVEIFEIGLRSYFNSLSSARKAAFTLLLSKRNFLFLNPVADIYCDGNLIDSVSID